MAKVDYNSMIFAAVVAVLLSCSTTSARHRRHSHNNRTLNQQFNEHMMMVNNFTCAMPQRRIVQLSEFMDVRPDKFYHPSVTVLNRCDCSTGYCSTQDYTCGPNVTRTVELVIMVKNMSSSFEEFRTIYAEEHVSCSCQADTNKIK